jgi:hypothetical protein
MTTDLSVVDERTSAYVPGEGGVSKCIKCLSKRVLKYSYVLQLVYFHSMKKLKFKFVNFN